MPTVKKRTDNDGYLKLISKAPDMENSTDVLFTPKPMRKKPLTAKKPAEAKPKAPKKLAPAEEKALTEELAPTEDIAPVAKESDAEPSFQKSDAPSTTVIANLHEEVNRVMINEESGSSYVNLGRDMPVHLL